MENTEQNESNKVQIGIRIDADLYTAVTQLATEEDRNLTNMIQRLLKQSPQVQEKLENAAVAA